MEVSVDGHKYEVEHTPASLGQPEWVVVWDCNTELVADAEVDHNCEHVEVDYHWRADPTGMEQRASYSYPYFEYTTPEELARWLVATHPENG